MQPLVSVIMPSYNTAAFIAEAVESILQQTYQNLELIIVDNASADNSIEILQKFSDKRIILLQNAENKGNAYSRNLARSIANGEFIALMDSDDYCEPQRIEKQLKFLLKHPDIDAIGSALYLWKDNEKILQKFSSGPGFIAATLFFSNTQPHAPTLFRKKRFDELELNYAEGWPGMEDYELFYRAAVKGIRFSNLKEPLYWYRQHPQQESQLKIQQREENLSRFFQLKLNDLHIEKDGKFIHAFVSFLRSSKPVNEEDFKTFRQFLYELISLNNSLKKFPVDAFKSAVLHQLLRLGKCYFLLNLHSKTDFAAYSAKTIINIGPAKLKYLLK